MTKLYQKLEKMSKKLWTFVNFAYLEYFCFLIPHHLEKQEKKWKKALIVS